MLLRRLIRNLLILLLVASIFAAVGFYIYQDSKRQNEKIYYDSVTYAVQTAIKDALYNATRTLEADQPHYMVVKAGPEDSLLTIAKQYDTTIDVIRMANNLLPNVDFGDGTEIIVPRGVAQRIPPRRFKKPYYAVAGDNLTAIAARNNISEDILALDNPTLAKRGVTPGDIVFIPELL
jgi:LysM repeat protein